ncbi:MAG: RluA family pseudouridine synthase [Beijerinckiaceae bacterium]|nr:RluA family pseudouridine synthase [Beijerinckiaceae bacterium]
MAVQTFEVSEDEEGMRLDRWFRRRMPTLPLSHLNKIVRTGEVRVDGSRVKTATRLAKGQSVRVPPLNLSAPAAPGKMVSPADLHVLKSIILYEDRDLLVFNKPFGLAVQGGSGTARHIDGMLAAMPNERGDRPVLVHRLDRDTSGVLLAARTRRVAAELGELFRSHQARKIYWALVEGVPRPAQGRISLYLAKGTGMGEEARATRRGEPRENLEKMRVAAHGDEDARHSVTYYAIVDKVPPRLAWLSLKPVTGRTHQLRAHAEAIGHPVIGDPKYGRAAVSAPRRNDPLRMIPEGVEQKLHLLARRLVLPHPRGGTLDVTAPLPPHMQHTFDMFGFDSERYDPIENAPG